MTERREDSACGWLGRHLASLSVDSVDESILESARRRTFDILGAISVGSEPSCTARLKDSIACKSADIWDDVRCLVASARASEVDDIHIAAGVTPGSVAVPVALAVGAALGASDRTILRAILCGYEAMVRVGAAIDGASCIYAGVWTSYVAAPLGAAAAAACLLELDADATSNALAIAASRTTGVVPASGVEPSSRWLAFGAAAAEGLQAAQWAACGIAGDVDILQGALPRALRVEFDTKLFVSGSEGIPKIQEVDAKPFCTARQVLAAVEAARNARQQLGDAEIAAVVVRVPAQYRRMVDHPNPTSRMPSLASVQFQIASALLRPSLLYDAVRSQVSADPSMQKLMRSVEVLEDASLSARYPQEWGARVEIRSDSGEIASCEVRDPLGSQARPLDWDAISEKYAALGHRTDQVEMLCELSRAAGRDSAAVRFATAFKSRALGDFRVNRVASGVP